MVQYEPPNSTVGTNAMDDESARADEAVTEVVVQYNLMLSTIGGEKRQKVEFTDVLEQVDHYLDIKDISSADAKEVEEKTSLILTVITNIGMIISLIIPAILGVKYMLGSVEEKAEYKKDMIPYLIGAFLLFGISTIVKVFEAIGNNIKNI